MRSRQHARPWRPGCSRWRCSRRLLDWVAGANRLLRLSRLQRVCARAVRVVDRRMAARFEAYVRDTSGLLAQAVALLEGTVPPPGEAEPIAAMRA